MIKYHVTIDLEHDGYFEPRIPLDRFSFEDSSINRVCIADSILGCLSALPDKRVFDKNGYIKVFEIIPDELGIRKSDILSSDYLYKNGFLDDSLITTESWITTSFKVPAHRQKIYKISWVEETGRTAVPFYLFNKIKKEYFNEIMEIKKNEILSDGDISFFDVMYFVETRYDSIIQLLEGDLINVSTIYEYSLFEETSEETQEVHFCGQHINELIDYILINYPEADFIEKPCNECMVIFPPFCNLKPLFLFDYYLNK